MKQELITKAEFARRIGTEINKGAPLSRAWATKFFKKHPDLVNAEGKVLFHAAVERYKTTRDATRNAQRQSSAKQREKTGTAQVPKRKTEEPPAAADDDFEEKVLSAVIGCINDEELKNLTPEQIGERTQKAQLVRAEFDAKMAELKFYKELGELIHIEDVERVNGRIAAAVRAALLGIPSKLSPALEGLSVDAIDSRLREEINTILTELNNLNYMPEEDLQSA